MEKKIAFFKFLTIIIFILIPLPTGKFHLINGIIIIMNLISIINFDINDLLMIITFLGILMIISKKIKLSISGFIICNLYLISVMFMNDRAIKDCLFLIISFFFLLTSIYTCILIIKHKSL